MNNVNEVHEALARVVVANRELSEVLTEITSIARRAMPSVEAASVTLIREDKAFTAAYDGQLALDADELQYERGYGPCVDAGRAGQMFLVDDMRTEQRCLIMPRTCSPAACSARYRCRCPSNERPSARSTPTPARHWFSTTVILSWPRRSLPGSLSQSAMQKQQPGLATISVSCAPQ